VATAKNAKNAKRPELGIENWELVILFTLFSFP